MNCWWCDRGCEGDTYVAQVPPGSHYPLCTHPGSTNGHAKGHTIPWETAGGTALSPNWTHVALHCHQHV